MSTFSSFPATSDNSASGTESTTISHVETETEDSSSFPRKCPYDYNIKKKKNAGYI